MQVKRNKLIDSTSLFETKNSPSAGTIAVLSRIYAGVSSLELKVYTILLTLGEEKKFSQPFQLATIKLELECSCYKLCMVYQSVFEMRGTCIINTIDGLRMVLDTCNTFFVVLLYIRSKNVHLIKCKKTFETLDQIFSYTFWMCINLVLLVSWVILRF